MDLIKLPSILQRWWWVLASVVIVTGLVVGFRLNTARTVYEARTKIQITAPQGEDVSLFDTGASSSSYLRDDLVLVRNNLLTVVRSREVYDRTIQQLDLEGQDRAYTVDVRPLPDSNFVDLRVSARTPTLAQALADAHAVQALRYYGELRAKPVAATKDLLAVQIESARRALLGGASAPGDNRVTVAEAQQAHDTYQLLLKKRAEAVLAEENALRATYIQVAERAAAPTQSAWVGKFVKLVGLSLVGSLGLGLLLALLLESLFEQQSATRAMYTDRLNRIGGGVVLPTTADDRAGGV